jgi:hypothetical protein
VEVPPPDALGINLDVPETAPLVIPPPDVLGIDPQ